MPATCPDASTPASVLPSTRPALSNIGVLAAITTCDQDRSLPCRIARPSRIIEAQVICDIFLNFAALPMAAVKPRAREPLSSFSTRPVRNTRCGMPATRVVTTVPSSADCRSRCLTASGTVESEVSRNRVPIATPAAPYDNAAASPRPSKKPPAAITGMLTASRTEGSSSVVAIGPVCPPPSPPWTITASAPQEATLRACLARPTDGMTTEPASFSLLINSCLGANANDATLTPSRIIRSTRSPASPASARMLTPNGLSGAAWTFPIATASSSSVMVAEARIPSPPALEVAATRRAPATQPIPVCTTGCSMPISSVNGVRSFISTADDAEGSEEEEAEQSRAYLSVAQCFRVDDLADQSQLVVGRQPGLVRAVKAVYVERGVLADLVGRDAGVQRQRPHCAVRPTEVEHAKV